MAVPDRNVEQFFELMQRFVRLRPRFVAPEPLAQFKRDVERLPGSENLDRWTRAAPLEREQPVVTRGDGFAVYRLAAQPN